MSKKIITEQHVENFKKKARQQTINEHDISKEEAELMEKALKEAKMPVTMKDEEFQCGDYELDIRELSEKNQKQMMFRSSVLNVVYLRQLVQGQADIMTLIMLILKKLGVKDIVKASEELVDESREKIKKQTVKH